MVPESQPALRLSLTQLGAMPATPLTNTRGNDAAPRLGIFFFQTPPCKQKMLVWKHVDMHGHMQNCPCNIAVKRWVVALFGMMVCMAALETQSRAFSLQSLVMYTCQGTAFYPHDISIVKSMLQSWQQSFPGSSLHQHHGG